MIGDIGMSELLVIFMIVLVLFGADRIPALAKGLGKGIREFKRIVNSANDEIQRAIDIDDTKPPRRVPPAPDKHNAFTDIASDEAHKAMDIEDAMPPKPTPPSTEQKDV